MSKFTDRLTRLHDSRVRALESDDDAAAEQRVFVATPEEPASPAPARPAATPRKSVVDTPARAAVRQQLEIGERLGARPSGARPKRLTMTRASEVETSPAWRTPAAANGSDNAIGERLTDLRVKAEALIGVGGLEAALPLLHEMAALSPTHPFPLTQLAAHWRAQGEERLADHYAQRLAAVAPY